MKNIAPEFNFKTPLVFTERCIDLSECPAVTGTDPESGVTFYICFNKFEMTYEIGFMSSSGMAVEYDHFKFLGAGIIWLFSEYGITLNVWEHPAIVDLIRCADQIMKQHLIDNTKD